MFCIFTTDKDNAVDSIVYTLETVCETEQEALSRASGLVAEEIIDGIVTNRFVVIHLFMCGFKRVYLPLWPKEHVGIEIKGYAEESKGRNYFYLSPGKEESMYSLSTSYLGPVDVHFFICHTRVEGTILEERVPDGRTTKAWEFEGYSKWKCTLGETKIDRVIKKFQNSSFDWKATFDNRWYRSWEMKKLIKLFLDEGVTPDQVRQALNIESYVSDEMITLGENVPIKNGTYLELYKVVAQINDLIKNHA